MPHLNPVDWSISQKVIVAPSIAACILGALVYIGWWALEEQQQAVSASYQELAAKKELALRLPHHLARMQQELYKLTIWSQIGVHGEEMDSTLDGIQEGLQRLDKVIAAFDHERLSDNLLFSIERYISGVEQALLLIQRSPMLGATASRGLEGTYLRGAQAAENLASSEEAAARDDVAAMQASFSDLARNSLMIALSAGVALVGLSLYSARMIAKPVRKLAGVVTELGQGNLEVTIPSLERRDEIGLVARAMESFKASVVRNRQLELEREQINQELERKVEQRTQELADQTDRLAVALDKERELSGLQRQFVAMVSHEFRTPLAIIDGSASRILRRHDTLAPERRIDGLQKIRTAVTRITDLMESVLSAARLEAGSIKFEPVPCDLVEMIQELCANFQDVSPNHKIMADVENLPASFFVDPKLLRQVISNLVSNAIKYSPDGEHVWIVSRCEPDGGLVISVRDEGVGIPAEELDKLFGRFFRASTSTGIVGTGIGLHIVKTLVDMHGGEVGVTSVEGQGTSFEVRLPVRQEDRTQELSAA